MQQYKIRDGFSFVQDDKTVLVGGDIIALADDIYALHAHKLEAVTGLWASTVQPTGDTSAVTKDD